MIKKVKNKASPIMTWFGGICMVPNALRNSDRTITMRVKEVTIISMAGAKDRTVISRKICRVTVGAIDCSLLFSPMETKGVVIMGSAARLLLGPSSIRQTPSVANRRQSFGSLPKAYAVMTSLRCPVW